MNEAEFERLAAQGYNRIPVARRVLADLETPLSAYIKLANGPYSFFFESVQAASNGAAIRSSACHAARCCGWSEPGSP